MAKLVTLDNLEVFLAKIREEIEATIEAIIEEKISAMQASNAEVEDLMSAPFNFTINGSTYTAKEGMTWYEWVNSEYNTKNFSCTQTGSVYPTNSGSTVKTSDGVTVKGSDEIVPNKAYTYDANNPL